MRAGGRRTEAVIRTRRLIDVTSQSLGARPVRNEMGCLATATPDVDQGWASRGSRIPSRMPALCGPCGGVSGEDQFFLVGSSTEPQPLRSRIGGPDSQACLACPSLQLKSLERPLGCPAEGALSHTPRSPSHFSQRAENDEREKAPKDGRHGPRPSTTR